MKKMSKLFAVLLAVVLMVASAVPAFADEAGATETLLTPTTKGSITIAGADAGDKFKVYQVMTVTYDSVSNSVTYAPSADFTAFLPSVSGIVADFNAYQALTDAEKIKEILDKFTKYCVTNGKTPSYEISDGNAKDVDLGQYVIYGVADGTSAKNVFASMTASFPATVAATGANTGKYVVNKDVTVTVKKTTPGITKTIVKSDTDLSENTDNQVKIGDTVYYTAVSTVPTFPTDALHTTYKIGDILDTGLTYTAAGPATLKVEGTETAGNWAGATVLTADTNFTKTADASHFELDFSNFYDTIKTFAEIRVSYSATVTAAANVTVGTSNTATLTYTSKPYETTDVELKPEDKKEVYTYEIDVNKEDATTSATKLDGVTFNLYSGAIKLEFLKVSDGNYTLAPADATGKVTDLVTAGGGKLTLKGLDVGTYSLTETATIPGYAMPTGTAATTSVVLTDADKNGKLDDGATGIKLVTVKNSKLTTVLPQTGGIGSYVFILIGLAGMVVAVIAFVAVRNKANKSVQ